MASKTPVLGEVLQASEQLSPADQLRLISLLTDRLRRAMDLDEQEVDMLTLAGLGADLWRGVEVAEYLEQERASWDS